MKKVLSLEFGLFTGEVLKDGDVKCVMNEGMPQYKNPFEKGKLVVKFNVEFPPDNFTSNENLSKLEAILPERQHVMIPDEAEECTLHTFDARREGPGRGRRSEAYMMDDDDDEDGPHGQRVQCASH